MQSLILSNSGDRKSGHIWLSTALGPIGKSNIAVTAPGRFLFASFRGTCVDQNCGAYSDVLSDPNDVVRNQLIGVDHNGNVFKFDFGHNKYRKIANVSSAPTALNWQLAGRNGAADCAIATADGCVRGVCSTLRSAVRVVSVERGHDPLLPANWISANSSGDVVVSSSLDAAILWDVSKRSWNRIRRLVMRQQIDMAGSLFVPKSDLLITAFSDASVLVWQPDTLQLAFRLPALPEPVLDEKSKAPSPSSAIVRHFAASADGRWLAASESDGCRLFIWSLDAKNPRLKGPRTVNLLTWLPVGASPGIVQSLTAMELNSMPSFMVALVDHSMLMGIDTEQGRGLFVSKPLLPLDIPDCHSISSVAFMPPQFWSNDPNFRKIAVLSAHSGAMFLIGEPEQISASEFPGKQTNIAHKPGKKREEYIAGKMDSKRSVALNRHRENMAAIADSCGIERSALVQLLRHYGAFPNRLRSLIWRILLKLPRNHGAFASLLDRGAHPCVMGLATRYPVRSAKLLRLLARVMSALAHWSPIFGETEFLPMFIFPFLHVYEPDPMACFELIATILIGFCQHWFEYAPHPPIAVLSALENLLAHADQRLLLHLTAHQLTAQDYAWPLLQTAFSEILAGADWLRVWDHIFANGPTFFIAFPVAYLIACRSALMRLTDRDEFMFFIRNRNAVDIDRVIAETTSLLASAPSDVHPATSARLITDFSQLALPVGPTYPVFDRYPKYVINFRTEERERLRRDFDDEASHKIDIAAGGSSRLFNNFAEDEDRRLRFQVMERLHNREDVSLSGALGNEALKPIYRGAKLESGLSSALEKIEVALERLGNSDDEARGRALLRNAAEQLLQAGNDRSRGASSKSPTKNASIRVISPTKILPSPVRSINATEAREQLRSCVSELRRDLHRRRLAADQAL